MIDTNRQGVQTRPIDSPFAGKPLYRLAWLPVPLLFAAVAAMLAISPSTVHESQPVLVLLNLLFSTLAALLVVILVGRSYLERGTPGLLLLGSGVLVWGAAGSVAPLLLAHGSNAAVTFHNTCVWLSALLHLLGAFFFRNQRQRARYTGLNLFSAYACAAATVTLAALATLSGMMPLFFVQGQGGTPLRHAVLGSAILMFTATAVVLLRVNRRSPSAFLSWYSPALFLVAIGLLGVALQSSHGSMLGWTGRAAQLLGGAYMLAAAIASVREAQAWRIGMEEALSDLTRRYNLVVAGAQEGIWDWDVPNRRVVYSPQWKAMRGYADGEIGDSEEVWRSGIHPEDAPRVTAAVQAHFAGQTLFFAEEYRVRRKDGSWMWVSDHGLALRDAAGRVVRMAGSEVDISAQKEAAEALRRSEARFRRLADAMPQLVWTAGEDGRVDYCNMRRREYRGIERLADGSCQWAPVLHGDDAAPTRRAWGHAVKSGETFQIEHRMQRADGQFHWHLSRAVPVCDDQGRIVKWFGTATDIEKVKKADASLRELNRTLEERVAERTELAERRSAQLQALAVELIEAEEQERRRISQLLHHDLQQILAATRLQLQTARVGLPLHPNLDTVEELLAQALRKTRGLSHELSPPVLEHTDLAAGLRWLARETEEQFGLKVELAATDSQVAVDASLRVFVFRAVQELLFNAFKHSGAKNARVDLRQDEGMLVVTVSDGGRGLDPKALDARKAAGGLGLRSLRERASYIGGSLAIESGPGKGCRITLKFPARLQARAGRRGRPADGREAADFEAAVSASAARCRVLFVDDHAMIRKALIGMIAGYPALEVVGEAGNGHEAVAMVRRLRPDTVVMDISMPGMDGIEATRRIKGEFPEVRVIGLSTYDDAEIAKIICAAGAETLVSKSASAADLLKAIFGAGGALREGEGAVPTSRRSAPAEVLPVPADP